MRLVCPNCEAKYEVPEDAIPETGRDVQCANCGHAWYQMRPRAAVVETPPLAAPVAAAPVAPAPAPPAPEPVSEPAAEPEPVGVAAPVAAAQVPEPAPEPAPEVQSAADTVPAAEPVAEPEAAAPVAEAAPSEPEPTAATAEVAAAPEADPVVAEPVSAVEVADAVPPASEPLDDPDDEDAASVAAQAGAAGAAAAASAPASYAVDDSVLAILREEAEREAQARRAEVAKPLEVQGDLGVDAAMPAALRANETASVAAAPATMAAASRTRLPDVEEIKSTLRPDETLVDSADPAAMAAPVEGRSSFRKGFSLVIVLAILGAALYVSADTLKAAVPALAGVLDAYVGLVDSLRLQLDGLMQSATLAINGN